MNPESAQIGMTREQSFAYHDLASPLATQEQNLPKRLGWDYVDYFIIMILAVSAILASVNASNRLSPLVVSRYTSNTWFEADVRRVHRDMAYQPFNHSTTSGHPLFVLVTNPLVNILHRVFAIDTFTSAKIVVVQLAGLWVALLYLLFRLVGCRRLDAIFFVVLGAISSSALFWFVVPETFVFGSFTLILGLCVVALSHHRKLSESWFLAASAATLAMTVTNWILGILAAFTSFPWRRAAQITVNGFFVVVILWAGQKYIFPCPAFFVEKSKEEQHILPPDAGGAIAVMNSFFFHSMVMPAIKEVDRFNRPQWPIMSVQYSSPGSGTEWGMMAVWLWVTLLGFGIWGLFSENQKRFSIVLGITILSQLGLHLLYGPETFLYAPQFGPLLVILAAFGSHTPARKFVLALTALLIIFTGTNNIKLFKQAASFYDRHSQQASNTQ